MRNIAFVIWMLGWPIVASLTDLIEFRIGESYTEQEKLVISKAETIVWIIVGLMVFEWR